MDDAVRIWQRQRLDDAERLAAIRARVRRSLDDLRLSLTATEVRKNLDTLFAPKREKIPAVRRLGVAFQPEANADLAHVFRIILHASRNKDIAEGFVLRIVRRCERVGDAPRGRRPRDDLEPGLRTVSKPIAY